MNARMDSQETIRVVIGIVMVLVAIRISMEVSARLFGIAIGDSFSIFGISLAAYLFLQAYANRRRGGKSGGALSLMTFVVTVLLTIGLCALSIIVPVLRT